MNEHQPDAAQERESEVLRQRAALLARRPAASMPDADAKLLEFTLAGQRCLLELSCVREVRPLRDLMAAPLAPESLLGVVHLRGQMLPVLDLAKLLGITADPDAPGLLLVVGQRTGAFAIVANDVQGLYRLAPGDVERRSQALEGLRPELVRGITAEGHLLLDGERLLSLHHGAGPTAAASAVIENNED